jgi:hypothetical protein
MSRGTPSSSFSRFLWRLHLVWRGLFAISRSRNLESEPALALNSRTFRHELGVGSKRMFRAAPQHRAADEVRRDHARSSRIASGVDVQSSSRADRFGARYRTHVDAHAVILQPRQHAPTRAEIHLQQCNIVAVQQDRDATRCQCAWRTGDRIALTASERLLASIRTPRRSILSYGFDGRLLTNAEMARVPHTSCGSSAVGSVATFAYPRAIPN